MELLGVLLYFLMLSGIGMIFVRRLDGLDAISRLAASWVVGSSIAGLFMFALVESNAVYPISMLFFFLLAAILTIWSHKALLMSLKELGIFFKNYTIQKDKQSVYFCIALSFLLLWIVLLTWTPPRAGDAMRYHLAQLEDIVRNHGFVFRPYYHYNFPIYFSLIFLPVYMVFKGIGIKFAVMGYFILSAVFTLKLANRINLKSPRLLVFLLFLTPMSYHAAHIALNDWVVVFYILSGLVLISEPKINRSPSLIYLSFLSLGVGLGVKYQAILLVPWFIFLGWNKLIAIKIKSLKRRIFYLLLALLIMSAIASPFYIRNFLNTGNPVWPLLQDYFNSQHDYLYQVTNRYSKSMKGNYSFEALFTAVRNIVVYHQIPFTIFFLALLGIAYNQKTSLHLGMGLFMFFLFWWLIQPKPYLRFCNFILPVMLISGVLCYQNLNTVIMRYGYKVIIGITLLYGIVVGIVYSQSYFDYFIHRDLKQYHKATWFYNEYDWINKNLRHPSFPS